MRKLDYLQQKKLTPTDELRDLLKQLEDGQPQLKQINPTQALITLRNLDQAYQLFSQLETTGADLAAERGRFNGIQAHLKACGPLSERFRRRFDSGGVSGETRSTARALVVVYR